MTYRIYLFASMIANGERGQRISQSGDDARHSIVPFLFRDSNIQRRHFNCRFWGSGNDITDWCNIMDHGCSDCVDWTSGNVMTNDSGVSRDMLQNWENIRRSGPRQLHRILQRPKLEVSNGRLGEQQCVDRLIWVVHHELLKRGLEPVRRNPCVRGVIEVEFDEVWEVFNSFENKVDVVLLLSDRLTTVKARDYFERETFQSLCFVGRRYQNDAASLCLG